MDWHVWAGTNGRAQGYKLAAEAPASSFGGAEGALAATRRPLTMKYPPAEIKARTPAQAMNNGRIPSFCARNPESSSPNTWANEISDIKVLLTRPTMAGGVSCCDMVCAGTHTKAIAKPMVKVLRAAMGVLRKAPSRAAEMPRAKSP